jgi:hypothetical protein
MTIFIHIGTHKTGTTAVQRFAAAHRKALRARGLWYPSFWEVGSLAGPAHHRFAHLLARQSSPAAALRKAGRFMRRIGRKKRPGEIVLISAEPLSRHVFGDGGDYWTRRRAYLERLRQAVGTEDVVILAVIRRQDGFARSLYQEKVKRTRLTEPFARFLARRSPRFDYRRQLSLFKDVFGAIKVLTYEGLAADGLVPAFFRALGVDISDLEAAPAVKRSMSVEHVEFKRLLNATTLGSARVRRIRRVLARRADSVEAGSDGIDWVSPAAMAAFLASYEADNERLRSELAPELGRPLFPPLPVPTGAPGSAYPGMPARRFAEIAAEFGLNGADLRWRKTGTPVIGPDIPPDQPLLPPGKAGRQPARRQRRLAAEASGQGL